MGINYNEFYELYNNPINRKNNSEMEILNLLSEKPMHMGELIEKLNLKKQTIYYYLSNLKKKSDIIAITLGGKTIYGLKRK